MILRSLWVILFFSLMVACSSIKNLSDITKVMDPRNVDYTSVSSTNINLSVQPSNNHAFIQLSSLSKYKAYDLQDLKEQIKIKLFNSEILNQVQDPAKANYVIQVQEKYQGKLTSQQVKVIADLGYGQDFSAHVSEHVATDAAADKIFNAVVIDVQISVRVAQVWQNYQTRIVGFGSSNSLYIGFTNNLVNIFKQGN